MLSDDALERTKGKEKKRKEEKKNKKWEDRKRRVVSKTRKQLGGEERWRRGACGGG